LPDENPRKTKKVDCIFSTAFVRSISNIKDATYRIEIDHFTPIKVVAETDEDVRHSWIIPPRIPSSSTGDDATIPESALKGR
jgi:hypothetical protein